MQIELPFNFTPRWYQEKHALEPFDRGCKRLIEVWHRRAGKDKTAINIMAREMMRRVGVYYYVLPTYAQGRKIVWEGIDAEGFKFLDHIPPKLRARQNNQEMLIEMVNGSIFRVLGSDNIDTVVGTNPVGTVWSEYSIHDPKGWDYFRPVLRENNGFAIFPYTARGRNHGFRLYEAAKKLMQKDNSEWYASLLTVDDTGVLTPDDIEMERVSGMEEELIQQEFYCSFAVGVKGVYYAEQIENARQQSRITHVPFDPQLLTSTAWDLGHGDKNAIWWAQFGYPAIRLPKYEEEDSKPLEYYVERLARVKELHDINYEWHILPHDAAHQRLGMDGSIEEQLQLLLESYKIGGEVIVASKRSVAAGINKARSILPKCYFDQSEANRGVECLESYMREWDEKAKVFRNTPKHNWASHGSDAFRTLAMSGLTEIEQLTQTAAINPITGQPLRDQWDDTGHQTDSEFSVF